MMRSVIVTFTAQDDLDTQLQYLIDARAGAAAHRLQQRFDTFLTSTLANHPASGRATARPDLWECWIPRTRLVVWYRFNADELTILRVWHTSRDRERATDDTDD